MTEGSASPDTIPAVLLRHAAMDDDSEFLRLLFPDSEDVTLSYRALIDEAKRWTAFYRQKGMKQADRLIVVLPHSVDLYAAYIGALLGGQVPTMFNFPSPKFSEDLYFETIGQLISGSQAKLVVTYDQLRNSLQTCAAEALQGVAISVPGEIGHKIAMPDTVCDPESVAFLQYSSGTTGIKKGVALSHKALLWQVGTYGRTIKANRNDRIVSWLPLYHDMGLLCAFFLPLIQKIPVVAISPFDWVKRPASWLKAVSLFRGTLAWMPNFAYNFMAKSISETDLEEVDLSSMRGLVNCSEPILAHSHNVFIKRFAAKGFDLSALAACYAMAENTFAVTSAGFGHDVLVDYIDGPTFDRTGEAVSVEPETSGARAQVSSGRPLPETELRILDADGRDMEERHVGEIVISSPSLLNEYDGNTEATQTSLRNGWFHTGDIGYRVGNDVFITGRMKDLIIVGGRNIYPQDIESVVSLLPNILPGRCVAFGVPDKNAGTEKLVVLAETEAEEFSHKTLRAEIYAAVAERTEVVPGDIRLLPPRWLVKSSSGKIARNANRRRYLETFQPTKTMENIAVTNQGSLNAAVRSIVQARLAQIPGFSLTSLNDQTPLLTSGLIDSFGLADLIAALETSTGRSLPPATLRDPNALNTIAAIITALNSKDSVESPAEQNLTADSIPLAHTGKVVHRKETGFWTLFYRLLFRWKGIKCGPGLSVLGPLLLQIDGKPHNIVIGSNVTLMPGVHLKNRENGRIILGDQVKLDSHVRLVAANDAKIAVGENVALGMGTVINAGRDVVIGRDSLSSTYVMINASDHASAAGTPIRHQGFEHAPILIGEDVFLGAHSYIGKGSRISNGVMVSAAALVGGLIPAGAIVQGRPARVIKFRT